MICFAVFLAFVCYFYDILRKGAPLEAPDKRGTAIMQGAKERAPTNGCSFLGSAMESPGKGRRLFLCLPQLHEVVKFFSGQVHLSVKAFVIGLGQNPRRGFLVFLNLNHEPLTINHESLLILPTSLVRVGCGAVVALGDVLLVVADLVAVGIHLLPLYLGGELGGEFFMHRAAEARVGVVGGQHLGGGHYELAPSSGRCSP